MRYLLNFLIVLLCLAGTMPFVHADTKTDDLYVSIGQALAAVNAKDRSALDTSIATLAKQVEQLAPSAEKKTIEQQLAPLRQEQSFMTAGQALTKVSTAVRALEETGQPTADPAAEQRLRDLFKWTERLREATTETERNQLQSELLAAWTDREVVVREKSIGHYGQVEMGLSAIRIALARETVEQTELNGALEQFDTSIRSFLKGDPVKATKKTGLTELTALLEQADQELGAQDIPAAKQTLTTFIERWPSGEGEVRTRSSALYSAIETDIPVIVSRLSEETSVPAQKQLRQIIASLRVLEQKTTYSFVDAMFVMLREGLEALLIISALVAFTRKAKLNGERLIWSGAVFGLLASGALAIIIQHFFSTAFAGIGREQIEGWTGLVAVLMMLIVGSWLHSKAVVTSRQSQLATSLAGRSLFAVSFLTIFREGAETLLFYVGMAPAMTAVSLASGILLAIGLIALVSVAVIYLGVRLPINRLFLAATCLIYIMAFKILGASIHALQLTGIVPMHVVTFLPSVPWIGFYPTYETMIPQIGLCLIIGLTVFWKRQASTRLRKAV
ncbi:FTR1 family iron permease [Exiguobacterium antarcticum]|uniref:FTR1 family iron permease n=1 Tax=Exiguobacterium antarcticum TaxID=132920 RepID=A0ABT6R3D0_9BACL|nr:FTR1 family protein [Exiguobacterium antarcticum]MDI3235445.1 FTR1 family iron permease [Exiguobacterium antarcticum]